MQVGRNSHNYQGKEEIIMGEECNSPRAEQSLLLSVLTVENTSLHLNYAFVFVPNIQVQSYVGTAV